MIYGKVAFQSISSAGKLCDKHHNFDSKCDRKKVKSLIGDSDHPKQVLISLIKLITG